MITHLKTLYKFRELLWMWTVRDIKVRYKQSVLGAAWAILQPLSLTAIFTVVFSHLARVPTDGIPYPVFAYTALLPWTLLSTAISFAAPSLVNNMQLVTKIYFPKEILPLASVGVAVVDFAVAILVFVGMMLLYQVPLRSTFLWVILILAIQIALMVGVSLLAASVNVFYRDIRFVVPLALQLWLYASPVIYPASLVPGQFRLLYMVNPMAGLIESYRRTLLQGQAPVGIELILAGAVSLLLCTLGYLYFKRVEPEFADII